MAGGLGDQALRTEAPFFVAADAYGASGSARSGVGSDQRPTVDRLLAEVDDFIVDSFESVDIVGPQWRMADAGFVRPTATWTYMVHDNPLGDSVSLGVGFARKYLRRSA